MDNHWIALLRAVNVGGTGKLPMAELRSLCTDLGFRNVATYIQSGNVIFSTPGDAASIATLLQDALTRRCGVTTSVILRTPQEWEQVVANNPLPDAAPNKLLVSFLKDQASFSLESELQQLAPGNEVLRLCGRELYIYFPEGVGQSKLNISRVERKLGTVSTARNWNTVLKLHAMVNALR